MLLLEIFTFGQDFSGSQVTGESHNHRIHLLLWHRRRAVDAHRVQTGGDDFALQNRVRPFFGMPLYGDWASTVR